MTLFRPPNYDPSKPRANALFGLRGQPRTNELFDGSFSTHFSTRKIDLKVSHLYPWTRPIVLAQILKHMSKLKNLDAFGPTFLIFVLAVISLTVLLVLKCPTNPTQQPEEQIQDSTCGDGLVNEDSTNRFSPVYWNTIVIPSLMRTAPTPPIR